MSQSLNQVLLVGRVGQEPKFFNTKSGTKLATFSLATTDVRKDMTNQELIKETQWHKIVVLNSKFIPTVENMITKGSKLFIKGKIQHQKYVSSANGENRVSTEITLKDYSHQLMVLDNKKSQQEGGMHNTKMNNDHSELMEDDDLDESFLMDEDLSNSEDDKF